MADKLFESKWAATKEALLEGLSGSRRDSLGVVLENTRKQQLKETATAGATGAGNIATLNKVMLPLIRRVMPSVIANEILGVQPMTGPVGQIHTLRVRYADTAAGVTAGTEALGPFDLARGYAGDEVTPNGAAAATAALEGAPGNRLSIQILKETVEARTRKLSARWTFEAAQDAQAVHGIDIEAEIMQALAQEITVEIDQEMINTLLMEHLTGLPVSVNMHELTEDFPDASFKKSGFAVRCNLELPAVDGSISYFNGYNPMPGIDILVGGTGMVMDVMPSLKAYRMHMIGGDFATTLGTFIGLRGEVAYRNYFKCYKRNAYIPYPELQYVVGFDKTVKDFSFILQYAGMYVFDFEELEKPMFILDYELKHKNRLINRQTEQVSHSIVSRPGLS